MGVNEVVPVVADLHRIFSTGHLRQAISDGWDLMWGITAATFVMVVSRLIPRRTR